MIDALIQAAQTEVENHSIYVWGGSGQLCCDVTEAWIRAKERGHQPDAAVVVMLKRETPSDGVLYAPLIKTVSYPEDPYYGVTFYDFYFTQNVVFSNTTSPTDPLVYEE